MPIRPERKHLYPANWKSEIVPMIKERSGEQCEDCGVRNRAMIRRGDSLSGNNTWWQYLNEPLFLSSIDGMKFNITRGKTSLAIFWHKPIEIILTVAHLNHDETDNRPENLAHLCQLHHNRHDAKHRAANRKSNATKNS